METNTHILDTLSRPIRDLRISVTDRCNFRCTYCMPKEVFNSDYKFLRRDDLLSFEEITRISKVFSCLGVKKIRLTGGEPLLRKKLPILIEQLANVNGIEDISLTTNGVLLTKEVAQQLKDAGLKRITISLDALDDETFKAISDVKFGVEKVLKAIDVALAADLLPVKINMVVKRGDNEHSIIPMAKHFHGSGIILRLIEFMDVGSTNHWQMDDVFTAKEIVEVINQELPIEPAEANYHGEVAKRWQYKDGGGEIGIISSVTQPFCQSCTRARLSAEGKLYTCLFATQGKDLRHLIREGANDEHISDVVSAIWKKRTDRYSEQRTSETVLLPKVEMSYIGG
ncbi:MAG: GTP 3',8-cyclase MoaA [Gammaproteobacteria bacterium]|nr:GTP 3',8-cyclase MoaA [Gammaproteobacteria bacterium]